MNTDTQDFLVTLLTLADRPDEKRRPFYGATIHQFSAPFVQAVDGFIDGFKSFLESKGFDMDRLEYLSHSFGGNCYLSLSGHGAGFFDEYADPERTLGDELQALIREYSGNNYRFEELESDLSKSRAGVIDLSFRRPFLAEYRAKYFTITPDLAISAR
jgi:hypothetical protein